MYLHILAWVSLHLVLPFLIIFVLFVDLTQWLKMIVHIIVAIVAIAPFVVALATTTTLQGLAAWAIGLLCVGGIFFLLSTFTNDSGFRYSSISSDSSTFQAKRANVVLFTSLIFVQGIILCVIVLYRIAGRVDQDTTLLGLIDDTPREGEALVFQAGKPVWMNITQSSGPTIDTSGATAG